MTSIESPAELPASALADRPPVDILPVDVFLPAEGILYASPDSNPEIVDALFGDKNNKGRPPPKIRGSQFVKREEKVTPKRWIRLPWQPKEKPQKTGS